MHRKTFLALASSLVLSLGLSGLANPVFAETQLTEDGDVVYPFRRSVSLSALSFLGGLGVGYEQLVADHHGVLGEAGYSYFGPSAGSWGAKASYRFHFDPGLEGWFLGLYAGYSQVQTEIELPDDNKETVKHDVDADLAQIGANFGYRWQWESGFAMVLRGGYGFPALADFTWTPEPDDGGLKSFSEAMFHLDLEFTVGYSF
jgi:Protein of unknown function (DUF3575)